MADALAKGVAAFRRAAQLLDDPLKGSAQGLWSAEILEQCLAVDLPWLEQNPLALQLPGASGGSASASPQAEPLRNQSRAPRAQSQVTSPTANPLQARTKNPPSSHKASQVHGPVTAALPSAPGSQPDAPSKPRFPAQAVADVSTTAPPLVPMPAQRASHLAQAPDQRQGANLSSSLAVAPSPRISTPEAGFSLGALSRAPLAAQAQASSSTAAADGRVPATLTRGVEAADPSAFASTPARGAEAPNPAIFAPSPALGSETVTPAQGRSKTAVQAQAEQGSLQVSPGLQLLSSLVDRLYRGHSEAGSTEGASVISQGVDGRHHRAMGVPQRLRHGDPAGSRKTPASQPRAAQREATPDPLTQTSRNPAAPVLAANQPSAGPGATASTAHSTSQVGAAAVQPGVTLAKPGLPTTRFQQDPRSNPYGAEVVVTAVPSSSSPMVSTSLPVPSQSAGLAAGSTLVFRDSYEDALEQAQRIDRVLRDQARRQGVDLS